MDSQDGAAVIIRWVLLSALCLISSSCAISLQKTPAHLEQTATQERTVSKPVATSTPDASQMATPSPAPTETPSIYAGPVPTYARYRFGKGVIEKSTLSPNGEYFAVGTRFGVYVYQTDTFQEIWFGPTATKVRDILFSQDGTRLLYIHALGQDKYDVIEWDFENNIQECALEIRGYEDAIYAESGSILVASRGRVGVTDSVELWDLKTCDLSRSMEGHSTYIDKIYFSQSGALVASISTDGMLILWDSNSSDRVSSMEPGKVTKLVFTPDERQFATITDNRTVVLWNVETGQSLYTLLESPGEVNDIAFAPTAPLIAAAFDYGNVALWNTTTGEQLYVVETTWPRYLAFDQEGNTLAVGNLFNWIDLLDVETGETVARMREDGDMLGITWSSEMGDLISMFRDRVILWDVEIQEQLHHLEGHTDYVDSVAISPDGKRIAAGYNNGTIILWDVETGQKLDTLHGHWSDVASLAFSPDGHRLVSGSWDSNVMLWDVTKGEMVSTFEGHESFVNSVSFHPDGTILASGSMDTRVILWDIESNQPIHTLEGHTGDVNSVAFSPLGDSLASASEDGAVILWDVKTGEPRRTLVEFEVGVTALAWSGDGQKLALLSEGVLVVRDMEQDLEIYRREDAGSSVDGENALAWSPVGELLAHPDLFGIVLRDAQSGEVVYKLKGHEGVIRALVFSRDGGLLVSGSSDGTVVVWEMKPWR